MRDWSEQEVALIVEDYLGMLVAELHDEVFSKTEHRRNLLPLLNGRTDPSVEYKHRNISYVMWRLGLPYIEGYKPARNVQRMLQTVVLQHFERKPAIIDQIAELTAHVPEALPNVNIPFASVLVAPPQEAETTGYYTDEHIPEASKINFVERDASNRLLGRMGEEWALMQERLRLSELGRDDLARRVEWVSDTRGDGLGFDILSWGLDGGERLIEVKTTNLHSAFPFVVTRNELQTSRRASDRYNLYRIFHFSRNANMFMLTGALDRACTLVPSCYVASAAQ